MTKEENPIFLPEWWLCGKDYSVLDYVTMIGSCNPAVTKYPAYLIHYLIHSAFEGGLAMLYAFSLSVQIDVPF